MGSLSRCIKLIIALYLGKIKSDGECDGRKNQRIYPTVTDSYIFLLPGNNQNSSVCKRHLLFKQQADPKWKEVNLLQEKAI